MIDKKPIIISSILLVICIFICILLSNLKTDNIDTSTKPLTDEKLFFHIQNTITTYIQGNNKYDEPAYVATQIEQNSYENRNYYYIHGYILDNKYDDTTNYIKDSNYFMIIKGNTYLLKEIDTSIKKYSQQINIKELDLTHGDFLPNYVYTEKNKLITYIANYINLVSVDRNEAFKISSTAYTHNLSTAIQNYSKKSINDKTIYTIKDSNSNTIELTETSIMNYTITVK